MHLIGIGGTGLSAIARVLLESGYPVSGSDRQNSPLAQGIQAAGARVLIGHRAENIDGADMVIRSSAVADDNPEVLAAKAAGIPVYKRADFLGQLMAERFGIAVAGTHGKTTTTAMIAWMLSRLGKDPTYIIGGVSRDLGNNAHSGQGLPFVIEADEYDRMFLGLSPKAAVVTNIEHDHPDCYPTPEDYYQAFSEFAGRIDPDGVLLACGDGPAAARLLAEVSGRGLAAHAYGISAAGNAYQGKDLWRNSKGGYSFDVVYQGQPLTHVELQAPGRHNVCNALAALATAHWMALPLEDAAQALSAYSGTGRRFDILGQASGVTVIDDYAHHPTEIRATLAAARDRYQNSDIWVVWQPHTYSRTEALFDDFARAFAEADHVIVTEVYAAREPVSADKSARQMVLAIRQAGGHPDVMFAPDLDQAVDLLVRRLQPGCVLLVLSAGDADKVSARVFAHLKRQEAQPSNR